MRIRPAVLSKLSPTVLLGAALLAALPARAEQVTAQYEVYFGGLHVLNAEATWVRGSDSYRLSGVAQTEGFFGWLHPWQGSTESDGIIAGDKIIPQHHENWGTASNDDGENQVTLRYDAAGDITETQVQPPQNWENRHPLPANAGQGTLDPMSVIAGLAELLERKGRCEGSFAVFDGRKRYNLKVSDAGEKTLEATDYSIYAGPAHGCRVDYEMLGGHRLERNKYAETARKRIIWVARPSKGAPMVPVRLVIETAFGSVMGHLTGFADGPQVAEKQLSN